MRKVARKLYYLMPTSWRYLARRVIFTPHDILHSISGNRRKLVPPRRLLYTGGGDYLAIGNYHFKIILANTTITPESSVLDIGCGLGRMAVPLTGYLNKNGSYEGFDIVKQGVDWASKNISIQYPNFHFTWINLKNDLYSDTGADASRFNFPYPNSSFNTAILISVFTHMIASEIENYLKEISQTLTVGGYCYATFFLLNEKSKKAQVNSMFNFKFVLENCFAMDEKVHSANIALEESYLHELAAKNQLKIVFTEYGYWSGGFPRTDFNFQDAVLFKKY